MTEHPATPDSAADDTPPPAEPDAGEVERLAEVLTFAVMAHYGYTVEDIRGAEAVHPGRVCSEECWDEDGENIHPSAYNDLGATAALMVEVVEPSLLASDWLAAHDQQVRAEAWDEGYDAGLMDAATITPGWVGGQGNPYRAERIARGEAGQ